MFKKLTSMFGAKPVSHEAAVPLLPDRPFTHALLLKAARLTDQTDRELRDIVGKTKPLPELPTLEAKINSAAYVVNLSMVTEAQQAATGKFVHLPNDPIPADVPFVIAFGFLLQAPIAAMLKQENHELLGREAAMALVNNMFLMHTIEERVGVLQKASAIFSSFAKTDAPNVREYVADIEKLVLGYVFEAVNDAPAVKNADFPKLFGSMLKTFLSARE